MNNNSIPNDNLTLFLSHLITFTAESPHSFNMSSAGGSPDKLKSVNEMERRLDCLEKENFNLRMRLFYQEESRSNVKPGQDLGKEIVDLKVSKIEYIRRQMGQNGPSLLKNGS